jgi:hypothetical protein
MVIRLDQDRQSAAACVTRGLDPRVHHSLQEIFAKMMDCRVKPGNDGCGTSRQVENGATRAA